MRARRLVLITAVAAGSLLALGTSLTAGASAAATGHSRASATAAYGWVSSDQVGSLPPGLPVPPGPQTGRVQVATSTGTFGWASNSYIKAHPGQIAGLRMQPDGSITTSNSSAPASVTPDSANGCNRDVCIDIQGSSLYVYEWSTTAYGNVGCTHTQFQAGRLTRNGPTICPTGSGDGVYYDTTGPIGVFPNHQQVCNVWRSIAGRPCETIHS